MLRPSISTKVRPLVLLVFAVLGIVVGILGWVFLASSELYWIASSLGGIEGKSGTNSLQAFEVNYKKGFRSFEIDLMLSSDDEVCAFSSLDLMDKEFGLPLRFSKIDHKNFLNQKYFGKFQPLCLEQLTSMIKKNSDVFFVIRTKESRNTTAAQDSGNYEEAFKRIYQKLFRAWAETPEFWTRLIPEISGESDLSYLNKFYRFRSVIYSLDRAKATDDQVYIFAERHPEVTAVSLGTKRFSSALARQLKGLKRGLFLYNINDAKEMNRFVKEGATGFYTDFLEPIAKVK